LDGQNFSVNHLTMNTSENSGIFSSIAAGAVIKNIKFNDIGITCGSTYCGGLTNWNSGTIERTSLTGKMICNGKCGGFASQNSGIISESFVNLVMTEQTGYGLGFSYAGLFAGHNYSGRIIDSYAMGSITTAGSATIGGLVGLNERWISYGDIINSYSTAVVSGGTSGGLVGWQYQGSTQSNSYWDIDTSGKTVMCGTESYGGSGCTDENGLTTAKMKSVENFVDWNFEDVWGMRADLNNGYPYLRNNHDSTAPVYLKAETVKKNVLEVFFDEDLNGDALKVGDFKVTVGETDFAIDSLSENNGIVTLRLVNNLTSYTPDVIINPSVPQSIKDVWGNELVETITKVAIDRVDVTAPTITLVGSSTVNIYVGDTYNDAGATATDNIDGDLTGKISTSSTVNTNVAGNYSVTFDVADESGNAAVQVSRLVSVSARSSSGGGSGGGSSGGGLYYSAPIAPAGGFRIVINNGDKETNTSTVKLSIVGGPDTVKMAISNLADFSDSVVENYVTEKVWRLTEKNGTQTVYIKFFNAAGFSSSVVSDVIDLKLAPRKMVLGEKIDYVEELAKGLKYGDRSDAVLKLQKELQRLGFMDVKYKAKGKFDGLTKQSLQKYRKAMKVKVVRVVELINTLRYGMRSPLVTELQTILVKEGYISKSFKPTGYYGDITKNGVANYWKKNK